MSGNHNCVDHLCTRETVKRILAEGNKSLDIDKRYAIMDFYCCCDHKFNVVIKNGELENEISEGVMYTVSGSPQPYFYTPTGGKICDECKFQKCDEFFGIDETMCTSCIVSINS